MEQEAVRRLNGSCQINCVLPARHAGQRATSTFVFGQENNLRFAFFFTGIGGRLKARFQVKASKACGRTCFHCRARCTLDLRQCWQDLPASRLRRKAQGACRQSPALLTRRTGRSSASAAAAQLSGRRVTGSSGLRPNAHGCCSL